MTSDSLVTAETPKDNETDLSKVVVPDTTTETKDTSTAEETDAVETKDAEGGKEEGHLYAGKYKSIEDMETGVKELTAKLREKVPSAPDDYKFDFAMDEDFADHKDLFEDVDLSQDPFFKTLEGVFKDHNISQEAATAIMKVQVSNSIAAIPDLDAEAEALGDNSKIMLATAQTFVDRKISEEGKVIAVELGRSAAGVKFLNEMAQLNSEKDVPANLDPGVAGPSSKEILAEAFEFKSKHTNFEFDTAAQKRYDSMLDEAFTQEAKEKSASG